MQTAFSIRNLLVETKNKTLLAIDKLDIPAGCHTAVIGPNGAGKSTLLKALIGLAGKGEITLFDHAVPPQLKQGKVAWVGQHGQYQMPLTLEEYVRLGVQNGAAWPFQTASKSSEDITELLAYFDLQDLAGKRIQTLSGGERQRANIVRALLQKAPVVLLDEPCNHLDIRHQHGLMHYLNTRQNEFSAVMVLHDLNLAARYAQYVVLLDKGGIVAAGTPEEVMQPERLEAVYHWQIRRIDDGDTVYFGT
ncbi:ABC transporter ATP-binding protein [Neisseria zalophi]|uniref:ABC transporter ATP-binding protein n=1 Tax=Neisseria zalophi TaxID=640030 RepID=A0A5J6PUU0_9NEIS|nr:ABC transporter ATP-binding protein [Neisseria zalophi]QEY26004.1 ABC transporter ATP-binding protein [Neisseria zalophi]